jgi:hypothetical protein
MKDELTLRDYFAAKALQGMLSDSTLQGEYTEFFWLDPESNRVMKR